MRGKILLLVGLGAGYVLGARAGREKYNEIVEKANSFWNDPRVKERVDQAQGFVKEKGPEVADFVTDNAKKVAGQVSGKKKSSGSSSSSSTTSTTTKPSTTATPPAASS